MIPTAGLIRQAGFTWLAHQVEWEHIETAPGAYDWSALDPIIQTANSYGLRVKLTALHAPPFHRSPASGLTAADPATYRAFMQAMAARYAGGFGAPSPTGANIPGQSIDDLSYLQQLFALDNGAVRGVYDALSAHPSGFSNPPDCTPATPQCSLSGGFNNDPGFFAFYRVGQYRDLMVQQESDKKIWFTEFGYCSNPTPPAEYEYCAALDATTQATFLVQAFEMARNLDYVAGMMQWNLNFQLAVPSTDEKWGFSQIPKR